MTLLSKKDLIFHSTSRYETRIVRNQPFFNSYKFIRSRLSQTHSPMPGQEGKTTQDYYSHISQLTYKDLLAFSLIYQSRYSVSLSKCSMVTMAHWPIALISAENVSGV